MSDPILVSITAPQTTRIVIDIPPRARDAAMLPVVTATRTGVIHNHDTGEIVATTGSETRVLSGISDNPDFPAVHAALKSAIDEVFGATLPE